ncbi:hypothetical protein B0H14DRAFT_3881442, partial [Mycena olivaceomarginata]
MSGQPPHALCAASYDVAVVCASADCCEWATVVRYLAGRPAKPRPRPRTAATDPTLALACCHRPTLPSPSPAATDPLGQTPTLAASRAATE